MFCTSYQLNYYELGNVSSEAQRHKKMWSADRAASSL